MTARVGNLLFIGGNIGRINGQLKYRGKVGVAVTLDQAYEAARNCALNHLAIMIGSNASSKWSAM